MAGARLRLGLALSALVGALLLVAMGGIVRTTGYGLGCPDWPLCYGRVIPPALTGAWVEFTHRFLGGLVAVQVVLVGLLVWPLRRQAPRLAWPAILAVVVLAGQVLLGGLHVLLEIPPLTGLIHTATAMLLLGLLAWHLAARLAARPDQPAAHRPAWLAPAAVATYLLLLSGSYVSRSGAGLACPAFPACGAPAPVAQGLIYAHMLHRGLALAAALLAGAALLAVWRTAAEGWLKGLLVALAVLLLVQGGLGVANVLLRLPIWSRVLHLAAAATFWAGLVFIWGLYGAREAET